MDRQRQGLTIPVELGALNDRSERSAPPPLETMAPRTISLLARQILFNLDTACLLNGGGNKASAIAHNLGLLEAGLPAGTDSPITS
jgi:hypothetical protein